MGTDTENWQRVESYFKTHFGEGEDLGLDAILFLIGIQELGKGKVSLKKDDKLNAMHIAVCRLLTPYGYYALQGIDEQGWPHYELKEELPSLKANEQQILMKKAIVKYFEDENLFENSGLPQQWS